MSVPFCAQIIFRPSTPRCLSRTAHHYLMSSWVIKRQRLSTSLKDRSGTNPRRTESTSSRSKTSRSCWARASELNCWITSTSIIKYKMKIAEWNGSNASSHYSRSERPSPSTSRCTSQWRPSHLIKSLLLLSLNTSEESEWARQTLRKLSQRRWKKKYTSRLTIVN